MVTFLIPDLSRCLHPPAPSSLYPPSGSAYHVLYCTQSDLVYYHRPNDLIVTFNLFREIIHRSTMGQCSLLNSIPYHVWREAFAWKWDVCSCFKLFTKWSQFLRKISLDSNSKFLRRLEVRVYSVEEFALSVHLKSLKTKWHPLCLCFYFSSNFCYINLKVRNFVILFFRVLIFKVRSHCRDTMRRRHRGTEWHNSIGVGTTVWRLAVRKELRGKPIPSQYYLNEII